MSCSHSSTSTNSHGCKTCLDCGARLNWSSTPTGVSSDDTPGGRAWKEVARTWDRVFRYW